MTGGQVNITDKVANYPGTGGEINGYALMEKMATQVKANNVEILAASEIQSIDLKTKKILPFKLLDNENHFIQEYSEIINKRP